MPPYVFGSYCDKISLSINVTQAMVLASAIEWYKNKVNNRVCVDAFRQQLVRFLHEIDIRPSSYKHLVDLNNPYADPDKTCYNVIIRTAEMESLNRILYFYEHALVDFISEHNIKRDSLFIAALNTVRDLLRFFKIDLKFTTETLYDLRR